MYLGRHVNYALFLSFLNETLTFLMSPKNYQISNFLRIRPVGTELLYADRQTDMTKLNVAFCNFANAPNNVSHC
jgi:cytochrome b involved in lipid metabolism